MAWRSPLAWSGTSSSPPGRTCCCRDRKCACWSRLRLPFNASSRVYRRRSWHLAATAAPHPPCEGCVRSCCDRSNREQNMIGRSPQDGGNFNVSAAAIVASNSRSFHPCDCDCRLRRVLQARPARDPDFTFRAITVRTLWPGATTAGGLADHRPSSRRNCRRCRTSKRTQSYSKPGESMIIPSWSTPRRARTSRRSGIRCARRWATSATPAAGGARPVLQ